MVFLILLILIGIILLVLEILVLPGLIAGIIGTLLIILSVVWIYHDYGTVTGHITAASSLMLTGLAIYGSLKSKAWNRFGLKDQIDGRVNEVNTLGINEGDEGKTLSALRPSGTVLISNIRVEAQSSGEFIDAGTKIIVTRVLPNKVMVKIKTTVLES